MAALPEATSCGWLARFVNVENKQGCRFKRGDKDTSSQDSFAVSDLDKLLLA